MGRGTIAALARLRFDAPAHGKGTLYRATALGPGVTPIVSWIGRAIPDAASGVTGFLADTSHLCG